MDLAIDTSLAEKPGTNLLEPFSSMDGNVEPLHIYKNIYLHAPFVRLLIKRDLMPVEAWTRLHGTILDVGLEVDCNTIINWLHISLTLKTGDDK